MTTNLAALIYPRKISELPLDKAAGLVIPIVAPLPPPKLTLTADEEEEDQVSLAVERSDFGDHESCC